MATFTFDGTASQTVAFNATVDRVVFNLDVAELASLSEDRANNTITVVATSGAVLTLTGTNFLALTETSFVPGFESNIEFGIGTDGGETVEGNVAVGLAGNDTFTGSTGNDLLFGNVGDDVFTATGGSSRISGGLGTDQINALTSTTNAAAQTTLLVGGLGTDTILVAGALATEGDIVFEDGDFVASGTAFAGNATILGGNEAGDPTDGADVIGISLAETGSATIFGNGGDDVITVAGSGAASVYGGQGDDEINASVNTGLFVGGLGGDTIDVTLTGDDATATIFGGNGAGDAVDGDDTISVTADDGATATIYGNGGDDTISVLASDEDEVAGSFQIFGGQGNDVIGTEDGNDLGDGSVVYGGLGIDAINVSADGIGAAITVFGGNGDADAADSADVITVALDGSGTDTVNGVEVPVDGQTAVIFGNGGDDQITLTGAGSATVFGGSGDDTIVVGTGQYALTGGVGEDTFDFGGAAEVTDEDTLSSITDFNFGEDAIDFGAAPTSGTVGTATLASAATVAAIADANGTAGQVAVVTVSGGDLAGSYAVFGEQVIDITGFTGTVNASAFGFAPEVG